MTDHIPADKIQDILTGISNGVYEVEAGRGVSGIAEDLRALLPAPTPRTLVQLIREHGDHHKYQWCQATRGYQAGRQEGVIIRPGMTSSIFMARDGQTYRVGNEDITPHPDLPPMAWPTSETVTESTPDHPTELTTAAEYLHAPAGTVVAAEGEEAWTKNKDGYWETHGITSGYANYLMAEDGARCVLRWGETL